MSHNVMVLGADRSISTPASSGVGTGLGTTLSVSQLPGRLYSAMMYVAQAAPQDYWLMAFDVAAGAVDGSAPIMTVRVSPGQTGYLDWGTSGIPIVNGIYLCASSTEALLTTAGVGAVAKFNAAYRVSSLAGPA